MPGDNEIDGSVISVEVTSENLTVKTLDKMGKVLDAVKIDQDGNTEILKTPSSSSAVSCSASVYAVKKHE